MKSSRGFTLIELMMAVTIIALLLAVTFPNLWSSKAKARDSIRLNDLKSLSLAAQSYQQDHVDENGAHTYSYPAAITDLNSYFSANAVPKDPSDHGDYHYQAVTGGYCFGAKMEIATDGNSETCDSGNSGDNYKIKGP